MRRSAFVFLSVWAFATLIAHAQLAHGNPSDLTSFYTAAHCLRNGLDPYDVANLPQFNHGQHVWPYLYSPLVAVLLVPLTHWKLMPAFRFWTYLSGGAFGLTSAIATHRLRLPTMHAIVFSVLIGLGLNLLNVFDLGQINTMVLVFITLAIVLRERRPVLAGACLAVAGVLKSSPFYLLVVFAAERRWKLCAAALGASVVVSALTLPFAGVSTWQAFLELGRHVSKLEAIPGLFPFDAQWSFSLIAVLLRAHVNARVFAPLITFLLTAPVALAAWRGRRGIFVSALAVMVLSAPLAYIHHVIYVFPGVLLAFQDAVARRRTLYATVLLLVSFVAGIDFPVDALAGRNFVAMLALYVLGFLA